MEPDFGQRLHSVRTDVEGASESSGVSSESALRLLEAAEELNAQFVRQSWERRRLGCQLAMLHGCPLLCAVVRRSEASTPPPALTLVTDASGGLRFLRGGESVSSPEVDLCLDVRRGAEDLSTGRIFLTEELSRHRDVALVACGEPRTGKSDLLFGSRDALEGGLLLSLLEAIVDRRRLLSVSGARLCALECTQDSVRSLLSASDVEDEGDDVEVSSPECLRDLLGEVRRRASPGASLLVELSLLPSTHSSGPPGLSLVALELNRFSDAGTLLGTRVGGPDSLADAMAAVYRHRFLCVLDCLDASRPTESLLSLRALSAHLRPSVAPSRPLSASGESSPRASTSVLSPPRPRALSSPCRVSPRSQTEIPRTPSVRASSESSPSTVILTSSNSTSSSTTSPTPLPVLSSPSPPVTPPPSLPIAASPASQPCDRIFVVDSPMCFFSSEAVAMTVGESPIQQQRPEALSVDVLDNGSSGEETESLVDEFAGLEDLRYYSGAEGGDREVSGRVLEGILIDDSFTGFTSSSDSEPSTLARPMTALRRRGASPRARETRLLA